MQVEGLDLYGMEDTDQTPHPCIGHGYPSTMRRETQFFVRPTKTQLEPETAMSSSLKHSRTCLDY